MDRAAPAAASGYAGSVRGIVQSMVRRQRVIMRPMVTCFVAVVLITTVGCSKSSKPTGVLTTSGGFRVSWPGTPDEAGAGTAYYTAMYADRAPGQVTLYMASVTDLGPAAAEMPARDHLVAFKFAFQKDELSRKEIEN